MKRDARKIALRFAVYTRVSTNSGLDQDFNSFAARHAGSISRRPHQLERYPNGLNRLGDSQIG